MDLAELKFVVNTEQLVDAAKKIDALATSVSKVNKPITTAALESEKLALAQAKVAEATAKAETAQVKLKDAQDRGTKATGGSVSVLERQNMILEYMTQGLSKGQSSYMATAKAAGALDDELQQLLSTLRTQRTLQGSEPFDKSIGLYQKLQNETRISTEVNQLFNRNLGLTEKQMIDLAREKERLIALYGIEGRSLNGLNSEYEKIVQKSAEINRSNNARTEGMKAQIKAQSDAAKATAYLADADARLVAALADTNKALDKQATDALVKYEKALNKTGMASDEAAAKLAVAKKQFEAIADKKQADRLQYLARAISVQMGDVGISLASGMNPLLVMIQQGDQIRGAIQQAGASGKELEKAMAGAATQIATSFLQTGQAIGGFFVNAIKSAGKAIFDLPISVATSVFGALTGNVESSTAAFDRLKVAAIAFSKVGIVAVITTLAALATAMYESLKLERELSVNLATTGSAMKMNRAEALAYAQSLSSAGKSSYQYAIVISAMAKEGYNAGQNFKLIADSAIAMEKNARTPIANTVKAFSDIADKPVEGIEKLAKEMRGVSPEVVKLVNELARQGKVAQASSVAVKEMARINAEAVKQIAADAGYLERIWFDVIDNIANGWKKVQSLVLGWGTKDTLSAQLMQKQKQLAGFKEGDVRPLIVAEKAKIENEIAGLQKQIELETKAKALRDTADAKAKGETEWQGLLNKHLAKESEIKRDLAEIERVGLKAGKDAVEIQKLKNEYLAKQPKTAVTVQASKDLSIIQKDYSEQLRLAEGFAKDERSILKARFDAGLIERADFITQDTDLLNRAEQKQLDVINSFTTKYRTAYEEQATLLSKAFVKAKDPENQKQLQEQLLNLTKDFVEFNATVEDTKAKLGSAFSAREQVALLEFEKAAFASTKTFKEYAKSQEDSAENKRIDLELQDRLINAYGAEAASIKAVADETKRQTAEMSKFTKAQEEAYKQYLIVLNNPNSSLAELEAAGGAYTTAMINANKAVAISRVSIENAGTDSVVAYYKEEYQRINTAITDSIVTALFEGGKAGSKKLRDLIVAELKKPITVMVKALVDVGMNALIGGGSKGGSFMESIVGSFLQKQIGGIAIGGTTLGAAAGAFGQGVISGFSASGVPVSSIGSATSGAFNAGATYGAPAAGAIGGVMANKLISQDYEISKTMTNLQNVATVAAAFIPGLGPLVALGVGAVSGLANRAFGMKAKEITGEGIMGTLTAQGADVKSFEDWFQKGGWFRSNKSGRNYSAVSSTLQQYLDTSLSGLTATTKVYASVLGLQANDIDSVTKSIELNLKGLSAEDRQKKIDEALAGFGNELAKKLGYESFDALQKLGEQVLQERYNLETQLLELQGNTVALRAREREQIYETNRALFDQIKALEDKKAADEEAVRAMEKLTSVTTTIVDEINRLRGVNTSQSGLESQFAILTAQARSGDLTALAKLPEITKGLEQVAASTAVNATDIIFARAKLAQSLQDTLGYTGGFSASSTTSMASIPSVSASGTVASSTVSSASSNQELLAALVTEVQGLRAEVRADVSHNAKTAKILERANQDGETLSVSATIDGGVV